MPGNQHNEADDDEYNTHLVPSPSLSTYQISGRVGCFHFIILKISCLKYISETNKLKGEWDQSMVAKGTQSVINYVTED